jgi:hypothetical protein
MLEEYPFKKRDKAEMHKPTIMDFIRHYIYVIHEDEFIKTGRDIYKVSRGSGAFNEIPKFPAGSSVKMIIQVSDAYKTDAEILRRIEKCKTLVSFQYKCVGDEYVQGNLNDLLQIVFEATSLINAKDNEEADQFITQFKENKCMQGCSINGIDIYMSFLKFPPSLGKPHTLKRIFKYKDFAAILRKHTISEDNSIDGPVFVFPSL